MSHEMDEVSNSQSGNSQPIMVRSHSMLAEICQRMRPHLKWVARQQTQRLPNCKDDESDIVQHAVVKAFEGFDKFEGHTTGQWRAWVVQIVRNHARDIQRYYTQERRSHKREERDSHLMRGLVDPTIETPSKIVAAEEQQQLIDYALAMLSPADQLLVRMRVFQGASYRVIAERIGVTEPTARRRCQAATTTFRDHLARLES